jgi:competence protein ComFC
MYQGPIKSLVWKLKFLGVVDIARVAAKIMYQCLRLPKVNAIVPVPLHSKRFGQRGYNQAQLISSALGELTHTPVANILTRQIHDKSQVEKTSRVQRTKFLKNQFAVHPNYHNKPLPKSVLLIDDVVTTGTTLLACAQVLKRSGVKQIHIATLAHGY